MSKQTYRRLISVFSGLLLLFSVSMGCNPSEATRHHLEVEQLQLLQRRSGTRMVTGSVYNPTDKPVHHAEIEVSLFDAHNRKVGTLRIDVRDIPANGRKSFKKIIDSDKDIQGARVRSILVV